MHPDDLDPTPPLAPLDQPAPLHLHLLFAVIGGTFLAIALLEVWP